MTTAAASPAVAGYNRMAIVSLVCAAVAVAGWRAARMDLRKNEERFACTNAQHSLTMESNKLAIKLPAAYQVGNATRRNVPIRV